MTSHRRCIIIKIKELTLPTTKYNFVNPCLLTKGIIKQILMKFEAVQFELGREVEFAVRLDVWLGVAKFISTSELRL